MNQAAHWGYTPIASVTSRELERRRKLVLVRSAQQRAKTECPKGHPYSPENTYVTKSGARSCRECARAQRLRSYHKLKRLVNQQDRP